MRLRQRKMLLIGYNIQETSKYCFDNFQKSIYKKLGGLVKYMHLCHMDIWMDIMDGHRKTLLGTAIWMEIIDGQRKTYGWT